MASFWLHFAAIAPSWHPFGDVRGLFRLAFSAFSRLELQGEPLQHHFNDFASFVVLLWLIFNAILPKTYTILGGRLAPSCILFLFHLVHQRVRCVVEAAPQARTEDHLGGMFCSSFVAEYHLGRTSLISVLCNIANAIVLSVFWQLRFSVILG